MSAAGPVAGHQETFEKRKGLDLCVALRDENVLIGAVGFGTMSVQHERAELGYWIGYEWWSEGYCTEATQRLLSFGFEKLGFNRIVGHHLTRNPASGRVMQKIGMKHEGTLRQHIKKWDKFEDLKCYGILRNDIR